MQMAMVRIVTWLMIGAWLALLPLYGLWVLGGKIADDRERKRRRL